MQILVVFIINIMYNITQYEISLIRTYKRISNKSYERTIINDGKTILYSSYCPKLFEKCN